MTMELIRRLNKPALIPGGCVATVGNFDGVHMGHQAILRQLGEHASELDVPAVVLTFEPQPREYFQAEAAPARLTPFREKFRLLAEQGVDKLVCLRFKESLAAMTAEDFVQQLFIDSMGIKRIIIGDDFRFGHKRDGDIHTLRTMGAEAGFDVIPIDSFSIDGERVSSSSVRHALKRYDFDLAKTLLGRAYSISGHVRHGEKRGRQLGFPTANIELRRVTTPLLGVYAAYVHRSGMPSSAGVVNIGNRPVFNGSKLLLEVHLLDFSDDLYGQYISVEFVERLRGEQKFGSIDELTKQISQDITSARKLLR